MPPKRREIKINKDWYKSPLENNPERYEVTYSFAHSTGLFEPGTQIKIKNNRSTFKFRCHIKHLETGSEWIDVIDPIAGSWHSFPVDKVKGLSIAKKSRRKRK